jgi:hypothetical protein
MRNGEPWHCDKATAEETGSGRALATGLHLRVVRFALEKYPYTQEDHQTLANFTLLSVYHRHSVLCFRAIQCGDVLQISQYLILVGVPLGR